MTLLKKNIYVYIFFCCCWVSKSCLTLCNPMNCSPPSSSVHGISQARILEWVAISVSSNLCLLYCRQILYHWATRKKKKKYIYICVCVCVYIYIYIYIYSESHSVVSDSCDTMDSMEFSNPEYWSGCLFLLQGIFPTQGLNPSLLYFRQILYQLSYQGSPYLYLYLYLYHFTIQHKLTQYCKSNILQFLRKEYCLAHTSSLDFWLLEPQDNKRLCLRHPLCGTLSW